MREIIFALLLLTQIACKKHTSKVNVPEQVQRSFNSKYPEIEVVEWQVRHDKYIANFKKENVEFEVEFIADGTFLKEEKED